MRGPSSAEIVQRAEAMVPELRARAAECEMKGCVSPEIASALHQQGFLRLMQSSSYGGLERSPELLLDVSSALASGCASTAWVASLFAVNSWIAARFHPRAQAELFGKDGQAALPLVLNGARTTELVASADGFVVSGQWAYCSGIDLAEWVALAAVQKQVGGDIQHLCLLPRADIRVEEGSWNVLGLRGTGSKNVAAVQVVVPMHRVVRVVDNEVEDRSGRADDCRGLYRIPVIPLFASVLAALAVGIARGALDGATKSVKRRGPTVVTLTRLGQIGAKIGLAEGALRSTFRRLEQAAVQQAPGMDALRVCARSQAAEVASLCVSAVRDSASVAGGAAIMTGGQIERALRDVHTLASHALLSLDAPAEQHGRLLLDGTTANAMDCDA
ncbi:hypothetical protein [Pseudorhodoplanes sp.]|uniref:hypothetical protein n=1 Tax=Pseudorhodoplanes sp. TaxID=1934341 RepID=UPI003D1211F8